MNINELNNKFADGSVFKASDEELNNMLGIIARQGWQESFNNKVVVFAQIINTIKAQRHIDKVESRNRILTVVIIGLTIVNIIAVGIGLNLSNNSYKSEFRPYVGISDIKLLEIKLLESGAYYLEMNATFENKGKVPANNLSINVYEILENGDSQSVPGDTVRQGLILMPADPLTHFLRPNAEGFDQVISGDRDWSMVWEAKYDGIDTKKHTSRVKVKYDPALEIFNIVGGYAD